MYDTIQVEPVTSLPSASLQWLMVQDINYLQSRKHYWLLADTHCGFLWLTKKPRGVVQHIYTSPFSLGRRKRNKTPSPFRRRNVPVWFSTSSGIPVLFRL